MMRVHHITNDYSLQRGGAQRIIRALHAGLGGAGIESHILGLLAQEDDDLDGARSLGLKTPYRPAAAAGIYRYLRAGVGPADLVHAHLFPPNFYLSALKLAGAVPCRMICTEHSTSNRRRRHPIGKWIDAVTYAGFDRIVAISEGAGAELAGWKPGLADKTVVIRNGARLRFDRFTERGSRERPVIVSIGRLHRIKNYRNALRAVALLDDLDFRYRIAGEGTEAGPLRELCRELGLESRVEFLGYVPEPSDLLAAGDLFLIPSHWEGFGLAAVEAMNAGLPVVASDVPGLREIVAGEPPCGILVDPDSPAAIAAGLRQLLLSPELRLQYGKNAFARSGEHGEARMVAEYLDLYRSYIT
jgi:glycosyltransferase involved in cell wall biosynthesis